MFTHRLASLLPKRSAAATPLAWARAMSSFIVSSGVKVPLPEVSVSEYISERIPKVGAKMAITDGVSGRSMSYDQLWNRIGCASKGFAERGVKDGTVVCIHLPNMPEYLVAFHGVASLGGVLTTSNPLYTATELCHQLKDSGSSYVVTIPAFYPVIKEAAAMTGGAVKDIFVIGEASGSFLTVADGVTLPPKLDVSTPATNPKNRLLCMPYSSGTTGLPKGVCLTHYNMTSNVQQCVADPDFSVDIQENDVCLGLLPLYHIYGMCFIAHSCIRQGTSLVTLPKFDPIVFLETIQKYKVTWAPLVPPIVQFLARHPIVSKYDLSSLRIIFSGAAPLDAETQSLVQKRLPNVSCRQGYGMSETSPVTHFPHPKDIVSGSVGRTVPNGECKIIDGEGKALGPGPKNSGELVFRGPNVMKEYLNNPTATSKTIIDGWLHTGDVAWYDERGNFYLVDRVKELIKSKGFQVAPAELEGLLLQHPDIADCAVIAKNDERSGEVPVAFVVRKTTGPPTAPVPVTVDKENIKAFISTKVAEYKQLADVIFVDVIPKSAAGKILRRELKARL